MKHRVLEGDFDLTIKLLDDKIQINEIIDYLRNRYGRDDKRFIDYRKGKTLKNEYDIILRIAPDNNYNNEHYVIKAQNIIIDLYREFGKHAQFKPYFVSIKQIEDERKSDIIYI